MIEWRGTFKFTMKDVLGGCFVSNGAWKKSWVRESDLEH